MLDCVPPRESQLEVLKGAWDNDDWCSRPFLSLSESPDSMPELASCSESEDSLSGEWERMGRELGDFESSVVEEKRSRFGLSVARFEADVDRMLESVEDDVGDLLVFCDDVVGRQELEESVRNQVGVRSAGPPSGSGDSEEDPIIVE